MDLPQEVPVMTLPNAILFPQAMLPLYIFEPRYRRMLAETLDSHRMFCVAMQKPASHRESPSAVAGLGLIRASVGNKDGTSNLILQGVARVQLIKAVKYRPYRVHRIQVLEPAVTTSDQVNSLTAQVLDLVSERLKRGFQLPIHLVKNVSDLKIPGLDGSLSSRALKDAVQQLASLNDPEQLVDLVSCALLPGPLERQAILETVEVETRLQRLIFFLNQELRRKRGKKS